jgi:hypothetical protein
VWRPAGALRSAARRAGVRPVGARRVRGPVFATPAAARWCAAATLRERAAGRRAMVEPRAGSALPVARSAGAVDLRSGCVGRSRSVAYAGPSAAAGPARFPRRVVRLPRPRVHLPRALVRRVRALVRRVRLLVRRVLLRVRRVRAPVSARSAAGPSAATPGGSAEVPRAPRSAGPTACPGRPTDPPAAWSPSWWARRRAVPAVPPAPAAGATTKPASASAVVRLRHRSSAPERAQCRVRCFAGRCRPRSARRSGESHRSARPRWSRFRRCHQAVRRPGSRRPAAGRPSVALLPAPSSGACRQVRSPPPDPFADLGVVVGAEADEARIKATTTPRSARM